MWSSTAAAGEATEECMAATYDTEVSPRTRTPGGPCALRAVSELGHRVQMAVASGEEEVDAADGLTTAEAAGRLRRDGPNALPVPRRTPAWRRLASPDGALLRPAVLGRGRARVPGRSAPARCRDLRRRRAQRGVRVRAGAAGRARRRAATRPVASPGDGRPRREPHRDRRRGPGRRRRRAPRRGRPDLGRPARSTSVTRSPSTRRL